MKAAAFARAMAPLADLENESLAKFHRELRSYKRKRSMTHSRDHSYEKPLCRRFTVTDASVEALAELLHDNPTGLLLYRDDLAAWIGSMKGNKQHRARELFLQAASGDGELICDRLGDDVLHVSTLCLSVFGGIDPVALQSLLVKSASHSDAAALFQRIQVLFWPDVPGQWQFVDPPRTDQFDQSLRELFRQFAVGQAVPADLPQHEKSQLPFVRLTPPASEVYRVWREHLESSLRARGVSSTARAHRARYRSLVPSLALLLRILDRGVGDVDQADFELALRWEQVLLTHARRVYDSLVQDSAAQILLDRLRAHRLHWESFAWEDLRRCQWSGLTKPGDLTRALITLLDTGHIRVARVSPSGRPLRYQLNPLAETSALG
jgi:hypothetical protein